MCVNSILDVIPGVIKLQVNMNKSTDKKVQDLLDNLKAVDLVNYDLVQYVRKAVFTLYPETKEKVMYGGILFSLQDDFGGIFAYKNHVSFEFGYGYKLEDPHKLLQGSGKYRRHLKIKSLDSEELKHLDSFLEQIRELDEV